VNLVAAFVQEKLALDEARWNDVLIDAPKVRLTKREVFNYYSHPKVRREMLGELKGRKAIVIQTFSEGQHVRKRNEAGRPIEIRRDGRNVNDPRDFTYFTERRATEFHPVFGKKESRLVVDLDPGDGFPWEDARQVAGDVRDLVSIMPGVKETEVRFSGGRGFYVIGHLGQGQSVDKSREALKNPLRELAVAHGKLTLGPPKHDELRLDLSPMKEEGSIRGLLSLNAQTGLVSVPVVDLETFEPHRDATIEAVLGKKPKDAIHVR